MWRVFHAILAFRRDQSGTTALEYCFIAFLISIVAVAAMTAIGTSVNAKFAGLIPGLSR